MAIPRNPDPNAAYWGADPTAAPPVEDDGVPAYWGGDAVAPYQPNPGAPGYNPNPGANPPIAGAVLGADEPAAPGPPSAFAKAFSNKEPLFLNPFAAKPIDIGDIDSPPDAIDIGDIDSPPNAVDMGELDPPAKTRNPVSFTRTSPTPARGGPSNPDPYGIGAAQKAQLNAYDDRMGAMGRASAAEQYQAVKRADNMANLSRMQEEDAAIARSEREYASRHFDEASRELARQLDDVRTRKVDPLKDFKDSPALGVLATAGLAIGGFYQGLTGGKSNEFMDDLNRQIDRGVAEQERQIREEKFVLGEGINMLHQQRQAYKDNALADLNLRSLAYEAAKNEINAEAERDGTAIARERANEAISQIDLGQEQLREQIGQKLQARAVAAAGQAHAHNKEVQATYKEVYKEVLARTDSPAMAEAEARRAVGIIYYPGSVGERSATSTGASPIMSVPKDLRAEAGKELADYSKIEGGVRAVNDAFAKYERTGIIDPQQRAALRATIAGIYKTALGPGMSSDADFERFIEPNIPGTGQFDKTVKLQQQNIASVLRSKAATPILDAHAKGWRQPSAQEADAALGAKPVGR